METIRACVGRVDSAAHPSLTTCLQMGLSGRVKNHSTRARVKNHSSRARVKNHSSRTRVKNHS